MGALGGIAVSLYFLEALSAFSPGVGLRVEGYLYMYICICVYEYVYMFIYVCICI